MASSVTAPLERQVGQGFATEATSVSVLRPSRFPISASVIRSGLESRNRAGSLVFRIRFSAARYSLRRRRLVNGAGYVTQKSQPSAVSPYFVGISSSDLVHQWRGHDGMRKVRM